MTHRTAKILSFALLAALFAAPGTFAVNSGTNAAAKPVDKLTELFGDPVIAKGKGVEVKRSQLDSALIGIKSAAAARGQTVSPEQTRMLEQQVLQRLIQIQLMLGKATDADKTKGKETVEKQLALILKRAGSEEALNRQLKSVGMTEEELRAKMAEEATAQAVLERELNVTVTEDAVKKFYDENPARFEEPEKVRASHILLSTLDSATRQPLSDDKKSAKRKQAEDLLKRARAGEDFAKLAQEYSEDPGSKDKGGEYTFPRGAMVPEFEAAAFSLNTNQISDIVTTQFGYHIIRLSEKIPAHKIELAKVADDLKEGLKRQELEKLLPNYIEKLKQEGNVEILDEKLKPKEVGPDAAAKPAKTNGADEKKTDDKK
ncbi:MAG: peptidylprolyl isomerase [Verrucomicrobiota bacterium]